MDHNKITEEQYRQYRKNKNREKRHKAYLFDFFIFKEINILLRRSYGV